MPLDPQLEQGLTNFLDQFTRDAVKDVNESDTLVDILNAIAAVAHRILGDAATDLNATVRLNAIPTEVLCNVLCFLPLRDLIVATHICRRWREVALAEPSLWTDVFLNGGTDQYARSRWAEGEPWTYPNFLDELLERARTKPVRVNIQDLDTKYLRVLCDTLRKHMHHIRSVRIKSNTLGYVERNTLPDYAEPYITDRHWGRSIKANIAICAALCTEAPVLDALELHDSFGDLLPVTFFTHCPNLRSLHLTGYEIAGKTPPVLSLRKLILVRPPNSDPETSPLNLFQYFPNLRDLEMHGVARPFPLPRMDPDNALDRLLVVPKDENYQFKNVQGLNLARIAHMTFRRPSPSVCRKVLESMDGIDSVELVYDDYTVHLRARNGSGTVSRDLDALCTRIVGQIFKDWHPACFDGVASVVVGDKLPWANALALLGAIPAAHTLTFVVSARDAEPDEDGQGPGLVEVEKFYDEAKGALLFDAADWAAAARQPAVRVLHVKAGPRVLLHGLKAEPDEAELSGYRAHRVSAAIVRALVARFPAQRVDELILDGVVVREGVDAPEFASLREMAVKLVVV